MKKLRGGIIGIGVVAFFLVSMYRGCIATTNEIGFLGADKTGRQIFLQSFDAMPGEGVEIDSDFFDRPFVLRFLAEPMRTTIRFNYAAHVKAPSATDARAMLDRSCENLIRNAKSAISLREDRSITPVELWEMAQKKGIRTVEDLLGGYGFKRLQVYQAGRELYSIPIRQKRPNVKWAGES